MRASAVDFFGTFIVVVTASTASAGGAALAPIAVGAVLAALALAGGHVSGGHFNPAVTLAAVLRGVLPRRRLLAYWATQATVAVAGVGVAGLLRRSPSGGAAGIGMSSPALLAEGTFTFAMVWVVLNVATARATAGNSFFGVAIGLTVAAAGVTAGPISCAVLNPAVALGSEVCSPASLPTLAAFAAVQLIAGTCAAWAFRRVVADDMVSGRVVVGAGAR